VQLRFLSGPAGSGKTFRCLAAIRTILADAPEGPPLILLAPKQTTYQLERELLSENALSGYTRLHVLSFERLAWFSFNLLKLPTPRILDHEGRLMVLRALLSKHRERLRIFRASARLAGFSAQMSLVLTELQNQQHTPESLRDLAQKLETRQGLAWKLQDFATLMEVYGEWLREHELIDPDNLLNVAAEGLRTAGSTNGATVDVRKAPITGRGRKSGLGRSEGPQLDFLSLISTPSPSRTGSSGISGLWVDGFAEFSEQELEFLAALIPHCAGATLTFCRDSTTPPKVSWLSSWSVVERTFQKCRKRFQELPAVEVALTNLDRSTAQTRFAANPILQHLECHWSDGQPFSDCARPRQHSTPALPCPAPSIRVILCKDAEAEATHAAREIIKHVHAGGRYRDAAVLVRNLQAYHAPVRRIFTRYEIPFFMDRREPVSHHPLAQLTRSALRILVRGWESEDLLAALKTGLVPVEPEEIDRLENEALARGWHGSVWLKPLQIPDDPELARSLTELVSRLTTPLQKLARALAAESNRPSGPQLAEAIRRLWSELRIEDQLTDWSTTEPASRFSSPASIHPAVLHQMRAVLENIELAFEGEAMTLREWLPVIEAGLTTLTVGLIPPALDQVLIGAIDRSRNPNVKLAFVLGMNESLFPARPEFGSLLSESDRTELERLDVLHASSPRQQLSRERFYAYVAFTRPRERLCLTASLHDEDGSPLNLSPFISRLQALFPSLQAETQSPVIDCLEAEHPCELIAPMLRNFARSSPAVFSLGAAQTLARLPGIASALDKVRQLEPLLQEKLSPNLAARLYGPVLSTSVSRLEQFSACPFKFFVHSGLRAEERKRFELDVRDQGSFQHDALSLFHDELQRENLRWRDITSADARARMKEITKGLIAGYRDGLLQATERSRFMARVLSESLQDFVETLVEWMRKQYQFDPVAAELPFGGGEGLPPWTIELGNGHSLALRGRIDRIDLWRKPEGDEAFCVVLDYKSSFRRMDQTLLEHGLQLQLLAYLNMLRRLPNAEELFDARLNPAGVFYVNLRGNYKTAENRTAALRDTGEDRKLAYQHTGRFDVKALNQLDSRPGATEGDQFSYQRNAAGFLAPNSKEAMDSSDFAALLDSVEQQIKNIGIEVFAGASALSPFRKGTLTACDHCEYAAVCRVDPWTQEFRKLKKSKA
jgi:ATP-dependent helicase/nuclease subunit B